MLKLVAIEGIEKLKADVPLYYLNNYKGKAQFVHDESQNLEIPIDFSLEMESTGQKKIEIKMPESLSYPILPLIKMLKEEVIRLDREGKLPW